MSLIVTDATKRRGDRETVSGVTLAVAPGERLALLGHNGAGKTTLIRMILGLTALDGGEILACGARPGSAVARAGTAYLPESVAFHPALTGREQLRLFARLRGEPRRAADALLDRVGLAEAAGRRIGAYSKGMRQRLGLAQALLGKPRLVLLDEPTSGLDPISRHDFYEIVDELAKNGAAVLLSSHALTELEAKTDRIAILRAGRLVANNDLAALSAGAALPIRLRIAAHADGADEVAARLGGARMNGRMVELTCQQPEKVAHLARIAALGALIDDVEIAPPGLEDIYRHYSREEPK